MDDPTARVRDLLRAYPGGRVHCLGVGGVGMAGLAAMLRDRNYHVDGCDIADNRLTRHLRKAGVEIFAAHDPAHLDTAPFLCVRSPAVPEAHAEIQAALQRGLPVFRRGEVFPALIAEDDVVAVAGTHGKTTTTALCVHAIRSAVEPPSYFIGGEWEEDGQVYARGSYPVMVVEADESDGTLIHYRPRIVVVTGIDFDHMEHFADESEFLSVFDAFLGHARDAIVYCGDDERLRGRIPHGVRTISYGFSRAADFAGRIVAEHPHGTDFSVLRYGHVVGTFHLPVPGGHNVLNALAALAVTDVLGLPVRAAAASLCSFIPVRRRLECLGDWRGTPVYSDYAHHPTEIRALVKALRQLSRHRILAIFQPHRYTRTRALGPLFPSAFKGVDRLVLTPVYAASEDPLPGGQLEDLAAHFFQQDMTNVVAAPDLDLAWNRIVEDASEQDVIVLIGAGDIERLGERVRKSE